MFFRGFGRAVSEVALEGARLLSHARRASRQQRMVSLFEEVCRTNLKWKLHHVMEQNGVEWSCVINGDQTTSRRAQCKPWKLVRQMIEWLDSELQDDPVCGPKPLRRPRILYMCSTHTHTHTHSTCCIGSMSNLLQSPARYRSHETVEVHHLS